MADENRFRSIRGHESAHPQSARTSAHVRRGEDPLAELARLIGQEDPFADFVATRPSTPPPSRLSRNGNDTRTTRQRVEPAYESAVDDRAPYRGRAAPLVRAPEDADERVDERVYEDRARQRVRPAPANRAPSEADEGGYEDRAPQRVRPAPATRAPSEADESGYEERHELLPRRNGRGTYAYRGARDLAEYEQEPAVARDPREERDQEAYAERAPTRGEQRAYTEHDDEDFDPRYARRAPAGRGHDDDQYRDYDPDYADNAYLPAHRREVYEDAPHRRRRWLVIGLAVAVLAVMVTSGVFAYRALFGIGSSGAQPKMIKSEARPNKIAPGTSAQNTEGAGQKLIYERLGSDRPAGGERITAYEEKPVDAPAGRQVARAPAQQQAGTPPTQAAPAATGAAPIAAGIEPKRVRTVSVRADGTVVPSQPAARTAGAGTQRETAAAPNPNQPLALNTFGQAGATATAEPPARASRQAAPAAQSDNPWADLPAQVEHARPAANPSQVASVPAQPAPRAPAPTVAVQTTAPAGRYVVQVSSRKSEAEAQADWQQLQARFAAVLGGQQATIRRADLGERGVFYRAQLGPYSARNQAQELCQNLKAAGGDCVVQRN